MKQAVGVTGATPGGASSDGVRPALVLSCLGAPEGDLSLTRSLGEQGVPVIVLSEYAAPPSSRSRHCRAFLHVPGFTRDPALLLDVLRTVRGRLGVAPIVFPSADPDLVALLALHGRLDDVAISTLPAADLTHTLNDKAAFEGLAERCGLPVPRSLAVGEDEVGQPRRDWRERAAALTFPLMAKPACPSAWQADAVPQEVRTAKALRLDDVAALDHLARSLPPSSWAQTLLQEYVPGGDEEHYGVHACVDAAGRILATSVTRNWRVYPPYAGGGCCMESVDEPALEALGLEALRRVGFRAGIANMDFKRHALTGEFKLLEINPRISQAHILSTRAGVNLPWIAWRDACGLPALARPQRRIGLRYVNEVDDLLSLRTYHRDGLWPWPRYLRHVLGPGLVYQLCQWRDPWPLHAALRHTWQERRMRRSGLPAAPCAKATPPGLPSATLRQLDSLGRLAA